MSEDGGGPPSDPCADSHQIPAKAQRAPDPIDPAVVTNGGSSEAPSDDEDDEALAEVAEELSSRLRRGERVAAEEYVERHPRLADRIRKMFAAAALLEEARGGEAGVAGEQPGSVVGRYKLLERIGEGGFGVVFMAEQQFPVRRKVALKLIKAGLDTQQVIARFDAERQALAMMDHPNIAKVHDAGATETGRPYFVMELVPGVPITEYCDRERLTPRARLALFVDVCHAVQHAHTKGVIHRDLKPTNVLVAVHDGVAVPKVIDFGVAKATGQQPLTDRTLFTQFVQMVGTPLYMSPEQAQQGGIDVDTRSDVYSLGVLLYELLTGTTPFDGKRLRDAAVDEVRRIIREEEPPRPSTRLSTTTATLPAIAANRGLEPKKLSGVVRGELDWIVMRCLEKDRARRYETANGLSRDIERYLADEPVQASPPSGVYRVRKFARRHRAPVIAASLVLLALLCGMTGTAWQAVRAERALAAVVRERDEKRSALAAETAARQAESGARKEAMEALANLTDEVVERQMAAHPTLTEADRTFLRKILAHYEALAALKGDAPESRAIRAEGHSRIGVLRFNLGDSEGARASYQTANTLFKQLAAEFPSVPEYRAKLASTHIQLREYREALVLRKKLAADFPDEREYRYAVTNSLFDLNEHREAIPLLKQLVAEFPTESRYRIALAYTHGRLGDSLGGLEALAEHRNAFALQRQLVAEFPDEPKYRVDLSRSQIKLGDRLRVLGNLAEAEVEYLQALELRKRVASEVPPESWAKLGLSHLHDARVLDLLGRNAEAEVALRREFAVDKQAAADFPGMVQYRARLANSQALLAGRLNTNGKFAEAEQHFRESLALRKQLAADGSAFGDHTLPLVIAYRHFGHVLRARGDLPAAITSYQDAVQILSPIVERDQGADSDLVVFLRDIHNERAEALFKLGRFADAVADWDRAIAMDGGRDKSALVWSLAECLARARMDARAFAEADRLVAAPGVEPGKIYNLARAFAMASAAAEDESDDPYATRAIALLTAVESRKYLLPRYRLDRMKQDRDLTSLVARPDYLALLTRLDEHVLPAPPAGPFGERPAAIPGVIQAEEFDRGGEGVAFHDRSEVPTGRGPRPDEPVFLDPCADEGRGHNVGGTFDGEWLAYTVDVARDGDYVVEARVAVPRRGASLRVGFGDAASVVAVITVPDTSGWQRWRTVSASGVVRLKAGRQVMRVTLLEGEGMIMRRPYGDRYSCNVNWVAVRPSAPPSGRGAGATTVPATTAPATAPAAVDR